MEHAIVDAASAALEAHAHEIVSAYLFGSVARGTNGARSDVDLAVLLKDASTRALADLDLTFELELKLKRSVDLVILNTAPPDLVHRILRDGILLLETDRRARSEFEVRARAQYFDLAPLRRLYRYGRVPSGAPTSEQEKRSGT